MKSEIIEAIMAEFPEHLEDYRITAETALEACLIALASRGDFENEVRELLGLCPDRGEWIMELGEAIKIAEFENEKHRAAMLGALCMAEAFIADITGHNLPADPDIGRAADTIREFGELLYHERRRVKESTLPASLFLAAFQAADKMDDEARRALLQRVCDEAKGRGAGSVSTA